MRLRNIQSGHGIKHRLMIRLAPMVFGVKAPDVMKILWYRPKFLGKPLNVLTEQILRGESEWTIGERELFGAWISGKNRCRYCSEAHSAVAAAALGVRVVDGVVTQPSALSDKARAMLPFLEKLTVAPDSMTPADLQPLRAAGVSDAAITDAIYVCMLFCTVNRLIDSFDCAPIPEAELPKVARMLLDKGYDM
jgi:uncharacterized peroxidase-related enzyme